MAERSCEWAITCVARQTLYTAARALWFDSSTTQAQTAEHSDRVFWNSEEAEWWTCYRRRRSVPYR